MPPKKTGLEPLGAWIELHRKKQDERSLRKFGRVVGLSRTGIKNVEDGKASFETTMRVALVLGISIPELTEFGNGYVGQVLANVQERKERVLRYLKANPDVKIVTVSGTNPDLTLEDIAERCKS